MSSTPLTAVQGVEQVLAAFEDPGGGELPGRLDADVFPAHLAFGGQARVVSDGQGADDGHRGAHGAGGREQHPTGGEQSGENPVGRGEGEQCLRERNNDEDDRDDEQHDGHDRQDMRDRFQEVLPPRTILHPDRVGLLQLSLHCTVSGPPGFGLLLQLCRRGFHARVRGRDRMVVRIRRTCCRSAGRRIGRGDVGLLVGRRLVLLLLRRRYLSRSRRRIRFDLAHRGCVTDEAGRGIGVGVRELIQMGGQFVDATAERVGGRALPDRI